MSVLQPMKVITATEMGKRFGEFEVIASTKKSQVASMVIPPDGESGPFGTEHPDSDQVLLVVSGIAEVRVGSRLFVLKEGDLILIEASEPHQVKNTGHVILRTLNFYSPPAY